MNPVSGVQKTEDFFHVAQEALTGLNVFEKFSSVRTSPWTFGNLMIYQLIKMTVTIILGRSSNCAMLLFECNIYMQPRRLKTFHFSTRFGADGPKSDSVDIQAGEIQRACVQLEIRQTAEQEVDAECLTGGAFQINRLSLTAVTHERTHSQQLLRRMNGGLLSVCVCVCVSSGTSWGSKVALPPSSPPSRWFTSSGGGSSGCHYHRNAQHVLKGHDPYHQGV